MREGGKKGVREKEGGERKGSILRVCDSYQVHVLLWYHHTLLLLRVCVPSIKRQLVVLPPS